MFTNGSDNSKNCYVIQLQNVFDELEKMKSDFETRQQQFLQKSDEDRKVNENLQKVT